MSRRFSSATLALCFREIMHLVNSQSSWHNINTIFRWVMGSNMYNFVMDSFTCLLFILYLMLLQINTLFVQYNNCHTIFFKTRCPLGLYVYPFMMMTVLVRVFFCSHLRAFSVLEFQQIVLLKCLKTCGAWT